MHPNSNKFGQTRPEGQIESLNPALQDSNINTMNLNTVSNGTICPQHSRHPSIARIDYPQVQAHWTHTLANMKLNNYAPEAFLNEIESHIINGVQLSLTSSPPPIHFPNTSSVKLFIDHVHHCLLV
jgi:hypothetical protein